MRLYTRGGRIIFSERLFREILCEKLGLDPDKIEVRHVSAEHFNQAVQVSFIDYGETFPTAVEGAMFELVTPILNKDENGKVTLVEMKPCY